MEVRKAQVLGSERVGVDVGGFDPVGPEIMADEEISRGASGSFVVLRGI